MAAHPPVLTLLRANRAVVFAVVAAAAAVALCAVVAVAWMVGWVPSRETLPGAKARAPRSAVADADALGPNETLVVPADGARRTEPLMPTYSAPAAPTPAPPAAALPAPAPEAAAVPRRPVATPAETPRPATREPYQRDAAQPGPTTPSFSRRERVPSAAAACDNCGVVSSITTYPGQWEVRVRLDEGGAQVFRFRSVPPYRIGDRVRVDGSRLMHD